jgi:hypothetical protein
MFNSDAGKLLKWAILVLITMWIVWYITGGPERTETAKGILIKPPTPLDSGQIYGPKI